MLIIFFENLFSFSHNFFLLTQVYLHNKEKTYLQHFRWQDIAEYFHRPKTLLSDNSMINNPIELAFKCPYHLLNNQ